MYLLIAILLVIGNELQAQLPAIVFELQENPAIVEGMTFDRRDSVFYFGESTRKHLLKYSKSGQPLGCIDASRDGMVSVLGMTVNGSHLWVCGAISKASREIMCLFQYDTRSGNLLHRYPDESGQAKLFNDVTVTADGSVFVTDSYTRSLYTIDTLKKSARLFLQSDSLKDPNGITTDGKYLYVSTSKGFAKVDPALRDVSLVSLPNFRIAGNDGLYFFERSLIGVQNVFFPITIARYFLNNSLDEINKATVLATDNPAFVLPTTGVVVGNTFYFMGNTNLGLEKQIEEDGPLKNVTMLKLSLD